MTNHRHPRIPPVSRREEYIAELVAEGASSLLARATDARSLDANALSPRINKAVEKYLLRDDENASAEAITSFMGSLQADDLCLVVACEKGDQTAWNDLVERFSVTVRSAARSATSNEDAAEDLAQSIWAELHGLRVREDGVPAGKLAYYSGRGSLAGWLRAVVAQLAIDQHRKQVRLVQTEEDSDFDRLARDGEERNDPPVSIGSVDPEQAISHKFAGKEINEALARSIQQLSAEDRLLVKLYYFDELRLREAGAVLGVHEATASRRLTRIHNDLRSKVQRVLIDEQGWTKAEAEKSFAEVALHLETDFEPLLASGGALGERAGSGRRG
jgi:RNA polymerase sigma-70 factor, ECF subfamily